MGHHEVNHSVNVICNLGKENRKKAHCRTQLHIPIEQPQAKSIRFSQFSGC